MRGDCVLMLGILRCVLIIIFIVFFLLFDRRGEREGVCWRLNNEGGVLGVDSRGVA